MKLKLTILDPKTGQHYRAEVGKGLLNQMGGMGLLFRILHVGRDLTSLQYLNWLKTNKLTPITKEEAAMTVAPRVRAMPTSHPGYRRVKYKQRKELRRSKGGSLA